jgi:ATP-dependent DNA helicase RecQ
MQSVSAADPPRDGQAAGLLPALKQHFGYSEFRPLQEEIIRDTLAGRDVFALLPTGAGKSLCFQLPALLRPGLTVVVSPLIALMKDQVDGLQAAGIPATFLNSSLDPSQAEARLRGLRTGKYRLLYVAPERLMRPGFLSEVQRWSVDLIAIDEAHCISEWGHDFRPEYRQLAALRDHFPEVPLMALTATATDRVRSDIIQHLRLRQAATYVASFNRPNLTYRVLAKSRPYDQVLNFVRQRSADSGIVYCHSRKGAESLAERLQEDGVSSRAYHAGLTREERSEHQERFLRDDVRVICATIAFGMGVHKPNVRFVIHYDVPKNVEGYYQETGRAGRDGLPGECVLLYSAGDITRNERFIDEKPEVQEQEIAREQLRQISQYAESSGCRRRELLRYFGEEFGDENCGACDNCLTPPDTFDGTVAAQKLLSCVFRIREKGGFGVGLNHVAEVLTGANTEKVRRLAHEDLPIYGIGKEHTRPEWVAIGRELVRLGYARQTDGKFSVVELTPEGFIFLKERRNITLMKPKVADETKSGAAGAIVCDETLFELLRQLRKKLADARDVPAFVVFSDVALRQMARDYPADQREFARISGVGTSKLREFGGMFIAEIAAFLNSNPRQAFAQDRNPESREVARQGKLSRGDSTRDTLRRFRAGESAAHIAQERALALSTVMGHLAEAAEAGEDVDLGVFLTMDNEREIAAAFTDIGLQNITGVSEHLAGRYGYGLLKLYRAVRHS